MKLQISLRRVLLLVAFIAAALGCFRACAVSHDGREVAFFAVLGLFFIGSAAGILSKQPLAAGFVFLAAVYLFVMSLCLIAILILIILAAFHIH